MRNLKMRTVLALLALIFLLTPAMGATFEQLYSASSGPITIPAEGATLTSAVTINRNTVVTGTGILTISGAGQLIVEEPLELNAIDIVWNKSFGQGQGGFSAIKVNDGGVKVIAVEATLNVSPYFPANPGNGAPAWFIRVYGGTAGDDVLVDGNIVKGTYYYGVGFLYIDNADGLDVDIVGNVLDFLHGGIYVNEGSGVEILRNALSRVSFGNIVTSSSDNLLIAYNSLIRAGNGTAGDAFTIVGGHHITIRGNASTGGSCYGMHIRGLAGTTMHTILVEDNSIIAGQTTAYYFFGLSNGAIEGVMLRRNIAAYNAGWGLVTQYVEITVEDLEFLGNAARFTWPQHVFLDGTYLERWAFNRLGIAFASYTSTAYSPPYTNYPFQ